MHLNSCRALSGNFIIQGCQTVIFRTVCKLTRVLFLNSILKDLHYNIFFFELIFCNRLAPLQLNERGLWSSSSSSPPKVVLPPFEEEDDHHRLPKTSKEEEEKLFFFQNPESSDRRVHSVTKEEEFLTWKKTRKT